MCIVSDWVPNVPECILADRSVLEPVARPDLPEHTGNLAEVGASPVDAASRFRPRIDGWILDEGGWLDPADRCATLEKARQPACARLSFADGRVPWADGVLVVAKASRHRAVPKPGIPEEAAARHPKGGVKRAPGCRRAGAGRRPAGVTGI
ncbi:hypothetical protein [Methylobacterium terrae]|uniref:hypothetical protein n=1 Tax=Methylobacterium terrae TaxID=2202827 RepID=UPI001ABFDBBA|nr:hypothetical protein [Methylobacterium terrae]